MVAKTIMHEVIHADIFAKLMSLKSSLKSNLSVDEMKELSEALNDQNFSDAELLLREIRV